MLNIIKMDLLRMKKGKSVYIVLGILLFFVLMTTYMGTMDVPGGTTSVLQEETSLQQPENINLGISFNMSGVEMTLETILITFFQSQLVILITGIFAAVFAVSELSTGFIKNIAGVVKYRWHLIISKNIVMAIFVLLEFIVVIAGTYVGVKLFLPAVPVGLGIGVWKGLFLQYLLHVAFSIVALMLATVFQSKVVTIIITVCLSTGIAALVVSYIDTLLESTNIKLSELLVSSNVVVLPNSPGIHDFYQVFFVCILAFIVYNGISGIVFQKRDIR